MTLHMQPPVMEDRTTFGPIHVSFQLTYSPDKLLSGLWLEDTEVSIALADL